MSVAFVRGYNNRYALSDLWESVFGDDPEFISAMYECGYLQADDVFALTVDSRLACAMVAPEYTLRINGADRKIRLISCVATDPYYRSKGYMTALLRRAVSLLRAECDGLCVIPVTEDLGAFYSRFGFSWAAYCNEKEYPVSHGARDSSDPGTADLYSVYCDKYRKNGYVYKSAERFTQAVCEFSHPTQSTAFFRSADAFAFVTKSTGEILVREYAGTDADTMASLLIGRYSLPVRIQDPVSDASSRRKIGMFLSFSEDLRPDEDGFYLNCMYN